MNGRMNHMFVCVRFLEADLCSCLNVVAHPFLSVGIKLSDPPTSEKEKRSKKMGISSFLLNIFVGSCKAVIFNFEVCSSTRIGLLLSNGL